MKKRMVLVAAIVFVVVMGVVATLLWRGRGASSRVLTPQVEGELISFQGEGKEGLSIRLAASGDEATRRSVLYFDFGKDLNPEAAKGQWIIKDLPVKIDPPIQGEFLWESPSRLAFHPEEDWRPATLYKLVLRSLKTPAGVVSAEEPFFFSTPEFQIQEARVVSSSLANRSAVVRLFFTYPVTRDSVEKSLSFEDAETGMALPYTLQGGESDREVLAELSSLPEHVMRKRSALLVKVAPTLGAKEGGVTLKEAFSRLLSLQEAEAFKFVKHEFLEGREGFTLVLRFSSQLSSGDPSQYVSLAPDIRPSVRRSGETLLISGPFRSGESYKITLKPGLLSTDGKELKEGTTWEAKVPDFTPSLRFLQKGRYINRSGSPSVRVETLNVEKAKVIVRRIYPNNLAFWYGKYYKNQWRYDRQADNYISSVIYEKEIRIRAGKNQRTLTRMGLEELVGKKMKGIFEIKIFAQGNEYDESLSDILWLNFTDLGLVYKKSRNALTLWALDLATLRPQSGVKVALVTLNNQTPASGQTGSDGSFTFTNLKDLGKVGELLLVQAERGDDLTYLDADFARIETSDFDTGGDPCPEGESYQAYLYGDRDLYRPDDTAHLVAVVRDKWLKPLADNMPLTLKVYRPDGRLKGEYPVHGDGQGTAEWTLTFYPYEKTGSYRARLYLGKTPVGETTLKVEEFLPERIRVDATLDKREYGVGEDSKTKVGADYLFGAPVAGGRFRQEVFLLSAPTLFPGFSRYRFGTEMEKPEQIKLFEQEGTLDEKGRGETRFVLPSGDYAGKMNLNVYTEVFEGDSGRSVRRKAEALFSPYSEYIGLEEPIGYLSEGKRSDIRGVVLDSRGSRRNGERPLRYALFRRHYSWVSYYDNQSWSYQYKRVFYEEIVDEGSLVSRNGDFFYTFVPGWGSYRLRVSDPTGGAKSDLLLSTYWWESDGQEQRNLPPERLSLVLDKPRAKVGESVKVGFRAPFTGKALLTVEADTLLSSQWVDVKRGENTLELKVQEGMYQPTLYLSLLLIKSTGPEDPYPSRAFGTQPLAVEPHKNKVALSLEVPQQIKPGTKLAVALKSPGLSSAQVTLAAVDEGILQITGFPSPSPLDFFFRKRRLETDTFDMFGMLLPDIPKGKGRRSGAGYAEKAEGRVTPVVKRVKPVALWSGRVRLQGGGARVEFSLPEYQGKLRIMAVAVAGERFGQAEGFVTVRDEVTLESSAPRFLLEGDRFDLPVTLFNNTDKAKVLKVGAETRNISLLGGGGKEVTVPGKGNVRVTLSLQAGAASPEGAHLKVYAVGGNIKSSQTLDFPVDDPVPLVKEREIIKIEPGSRTLSWSGEGWKGKGPRVTLGLSPFGFIREMSFVKNLLEYPYGCLEQTTSASFPLLYLKEILQITAPEALKKATLPQLVQKGIERVLSMQTVSGGFAFWPGETYENPWGSCYALHFLLEASEAGYNVPEYTVENALRYLQETLPYKKGEGSITSRFDRGAYAIYLLSRKKKVDGSTILSYQQRFEPLFSTEGRAFMAAALFRSGDFQRGRELMRRVEGAEGKPNGESFFTPLRRDSLRLFLTEEMGMPVDLSLLQRVAGEIVSQGEGFYTTQEMAWGLLALGKRLRKEGASTELKADLKTAAGRLLKSVSGPGGSHVVSPGETSVEVVNKGGSPFTLLLLKEGRRSGGEEKETERGVAVERSYYTIDGRPLLTGSGELRVRQGSLVVVKLSVRSTAGVPFRQVALDDRIPAGFEIENPRLGKEHPLPWIGAPTLEPRFMDIRDDRLSLFFDLEKKELFFYYVIRAVNRGRFRLPPARCEVMYEPENSSQRGGGWAEVEG